MFRLLVLPWRFLTLATAAAGVAAQGIPDLVAGPAPVLPPSARAEVPDVQPAIGSPANEAIWRVPIHTMKDDPDYGVWASEGGYKVSFHDGFAFYPYLGPDHPENLPLRWRTISVTAGGQELLQPGESPCHARADWRYEYRCQRFVEAYDVTPQGVEQTFTIHERPARAGTIVVRGEVKTRLQAAPVREQHGRIAFADADGKTLVVYGEAFAVDALGQRTNVLTSYDGRHIELALDAQFVAAATFPVVIDPLTSPVVIATWQGPNGKIWESSIGRENESQNANVMIAYSRSPAATDSDLYVRLCRDDFSGSVTVFSHISTTYSTSYPSVAAVGGANRWVVAYEVSVGSAGSVDAYVHDFGNTAFQSGTVLSVNSGGGGISWRPRVGGQRSFTAGAMALIVFGYKNASGQGEVYGRFVDAGNPTSVPPRPPAVVGSNVYLAGGPALPGVSRHDPCINQESGGGDASWIIGWTEFSSNIPEVRIARMSRTYLSRSVSMRFTNQNLDPQIAGRDGRYLISFVSVSNLGRYGLYAQRIDWPETSPAPNVQIVRPVTENTGTLVNTGVAYDSTSASHWAVVWEHPHASSDLFTARVGSSGGVVEMRTLYNHPTAAGSASSITFDERARSFLISYGTNEPTMPLHGVRLTYPPDAISVPYGTGCGGSIGSTAPDAGSEFFRVTLSAGAQNANQPAALFAGFQPASLDLAVLGMPGCFLNTNPVATFGMTTNASAVASFVLRLQDAPVFLGDLNFQWAFVSPSAPWPLKVATTRGLRAQVR
jgi:hypothetical protein